VTRGIFVAFEGIDASGKSTQARRVAALAEALFTFEPGDTPLGAELRRWLLDASAPMSPETEALLMLADRSHHVSSVIEPALVSGRHVVSDRFAASTIAYQGFGRGLDVRQLLDATELAIGECRPDLTILCDVDVEVAYARRHPDSADRFESSARDFHERVREGFLEQARSHPDNWVIVDAHGDLESVTEQVNGYLRKVGWPGL